MNRIDERKIVFEIAFTFSFNSNKTVDEIINIYKEANELTDLSDYIISTLSGIYTNLDSIDNVIESTIKTRSMDRLDNVCLTALRYGTYELLYSKDIPDVVAINEAIELTKKYDDTLASFVHGNLAIISKGDK